MRLRTQLSLAFALVAILGVGAALFAAERYLAHTARQTLASELSRSAEVYTTFATERAARREAEARVVAEEPRLKAAVRTVEIDQETLDDVADELKRASGADLLVLTDRTGTVLADASSLNLNDVATRAGFKEVAQKGGGVTTWEAKGALYQVPVRPLRFGTEVTGYLVTGYRVSDEVLAQARTQTGAEAALLVDGKIAAQAMRPGILPAGATVLASAPLGNSEVSLGGERFLIHKFEHPLMTPGKAQLVLARSLDEALAEHAQVRKTLALIGGLTLLLALGVAMVLAGRLTRRMESLSKAAVQIGEGDLSVRVDDSGADEVGTLGAAFNQMTTELVRSRAALVDRERLQKEMQIAQQIQTALLPNTLEAPGYRIEAAMLTAEDVGGDLYDVINAPDGHLWLCIGDVTSHGLTPGLIMMMVQSAFSALVSKDPGARPMDVLQHLNRVIYSNVRERVRDDNYLTLTILRSDGPGRFIYAGAHLDLLVRRADGKVDRFATPGMWVGLMPEIDSLEESTVELGPGDSLVLYTDGLTESRSASGEQLELERVMKVMSQNRGAAEIKDALIEAARQHMAQQDDDITVVVVEREGQ